MTRRRMIAGTMMAIVAGVRSLKAHPNFRIIGTITQATATAIAVKQTKDGRIIRMDMDGESRVTRDKVPVNRSELKAGRYVVVDACGETLDDLLVMEIRLVPTPTKQ